MNKSFITPLFISPPTLGGEINTVCYLVLSNIHVLFTLIYVPLPNICVPFTGIYVMKWMFRTWDAVNGTQGNAGVGE